MQSINEVLSEPLQIPPLKPGQRMEFRTINYSVMDERYGGPVRGTHTIFGQDTIFDPFDNKIPNKVIYNITGHKPVGDGINRRMEIQFDYVRFGSLGSIVCDHMSNNKYFYLMRSNRNRDNKYRIGNNVKFYTVDEARDLRNLQSNFDYKAIAAYHLRGVKTSEELVALAMRMNQLWNGTYTKIDTKMDAKNIRLNLQMLSQKNPAQYLFATDIEENVARVVADVAVEEMWIYFNDHPEKRVWEWKRNPGEKGAKKIVTVADSEEAIEKLIAFLSTTKEGSEHFIELKARYEKYYANALA